MPVASSTASRKRKITEDAVESPPKRQTRARAAKATQEESSTKPKTTRITTASARIAAEARAVAKAAPKPKATATPSAKREAKPPKDVTKSAKPQVKPDKPISSASRSSTTRATKSKEKTVGQDVPKTRSRKATTIEPEVKRTVRTRSATIESEATSKMNPASKKAVKRVTFQEDLIQEKENKPIPTKKESSTGIKAKPVRKIIKTPTATRSRRPTAASLSKATPLSPKKVTQVAKSLSSSEDELLRTPPSKTSKALATAISADDTTSELKHSPTKPKALDASILLASPAKRPPPSPFKDGLSQSPRKFPVLGVMPDLSKTISLEPNAESLKQPPMKFDFTPIRPTAGKPDVGATARAALLRSPARRPASPLKLGSARTHNRVAAPRVLTNTTSIIRHVKDGSLFSATPRRLFKSPAKTTLQSPTGQAETAASGLIEAMKRAEDPTISDAQTPSPYGFKKYTETVQFGNAGETFEHDVFEDSGHYRSLEDNSEDELSMGPFTSSPQKREMLMKKLASSPSYSTASPVKALITPNTRAKNQFMTPLAVQLSNWLATSPTRSERGDEPSIGAFTPATKVPKSNRASRRTTMTPAAKLTCFEEQLPQIEVLATPEESMMDQDLHTKDDIDMVDDVVSDSAEEVIAATPEESLHLDGIACISDLKESSTDDQRFDDNIEFNPPVQQTPLDIDTSENRTLDCVSSTLGEVIMESDDVLISDDSDNKEADETVVITRPQITSQENSVYITTEDVPQHLMETLPKADTSVIIPASSGISFESTEYGDENCEPMLPEISQVLPEMNVITKNLHTPVRPSAARQKEIQTVARVPLKPSSDETPLQVKIRRGRSKSMSGEAVLMPIKPLGDIIDPNNASSKIQEPIQNNPTTPRSVTQPLKAPVTPGDELIALAQTPFKSVRKGPDASILRGAIVHVDVHTSEGADASGIFVELLTQMGARCIKQWSWNPRNTLSGSEDLAANTKVGVTHVVFKDGSKRTLQKVREAKGLVLCVGVGWVLDCERTNKWLDEAPFAVDTSTIPRGGHNRRKSMEPTLLASLEGNLSSIRTPAKRKSVRLSKSRKSNAASPAKPDMDETILLPFTPGKDDTSVNPTTPSLDTENVQLLQRTCPPKQSRSNVFSSEGHRDQSSKDIKFRITKARRKTMQFVPQVASPLSQEFPGDD